MPPPLVLLAPPADAARTLLAPHVTLADVPPDGSALPAGVAAVVVGVGDLRAAVRRTRLWRADVGERPLGIVWALAEPTPEAIVAGLDAGADACVPMHDPGLLVAQVRAAVRQHTLAAALAAKADDARTLNERLLRAHERLDADTRLADAVLASLPATATNLGAVRFDVAHGAAGRAPGQLCHAARVGPHHVGVLIADLGTTHLGVLGPLARLAAVGSEWTHDGPRVVPPAEVLARVNRALVALAFDPPVLAGVVYALIDTAAGRVDVARGGLPPAVHVPADPDEEPAPLPGPAPFLGPFEATFDAVAHDLRPGDRVVLHTAGRDEYVRAAAAKYRDRGGPDFADPVAREGLAPFPGTVLVLSLGEPGA